VVVPKIGSYYGIARTNIKRTINEDDFDNNDKISDNTVGVDAFELVLEQSQPDSLKNGKARYYKINVPAEKDLLVSVTTGFTKQMAGNNTVYVAHDRVPTSFDYDAAHINAISLNQEVLVSGTKEGTYYVRIESKDVYGEQPVTVLARALPFSIIRTTPSVAGKDETSSQLFGAGFRSNTQVVLRNAANETITTALVTQFVNSTQLRLKWDFRNVPTGTYSIVAVNPNGQEAKLANGLKIVASSGYVLEFTPLTPNQVRRSQTGFFTFKARNNGNIDIPVVHGDFTMPGYTKIKEVTVQGNVRKQSQYYPDTLLYKEGDFYEQDNAIVVPFLSRNLAPGEEFTVSFFASNFIDNSFPIRPRAYGYSAREFARQQIGRLEILRQSIIQNPGYFGLSATDSLFIYAGNREAFIGGMLNNYYESGLLTPMEVAGINADCLECLLHIDTAALGPKFVYTYSPGNSPGVAQINGNATFSGGENFLWEINKSLYWPGYTGVVGKAGENPGWDLLKVSGSLDVSATAEKPFTVYVASLGYDNGPGRLAGWHPAGDTSYAMVVAANGINNFDSSKFVVDATQFQRYNNTYGGYWYLRLKKGAEDTLFLCFRSYKPGVGEAGVPGAPGVEGEPGSPGGKGGPGSGIIPPGNGGPGGSGGKGNVGQNGGDGGQGGEGGDGTAGQNGGSGGNGGIAGSGGIGANGGTGGAGGKGGKGGDGANGGNGGNGGNGANGGNNGNGGNGGRGGDGGTGVSPGNGGNGGHGGNSGGGNSHGGDGGTGGTGSNGTGTTGDPGGGNGGSGSGGPGEGSPCSQSNGGNSDMCNLFMDVLAVGGKSAQAGKAPWKDLGWLAASKLAGDNCVAGSFVACAKSIYTGFKAMGTEASWWGPGVGALKCGLKIGDCINQGIYGRKDYPGSDIVKDLIDGADCIGSVIDLGKCAGKKMFCTPVLNPCDPNEIIGPPSYGSAYMIAAKADHPYSIHFENDSTFATTAAQRVVIHQPVHPNLDPLSFRLGDFGFGKRSFQITGSQSSYFTVLNLSDSLGFNVEVTAGLDVVKNELFWVFQAIDPVTGLPPSNPLSGFLPVNDVLNSGQGFVNYTIRPKSGVQTGDSVTAKAEIVFDTNDPIATNTWLNTIDAVVPASAMKPLPQKSSAAAVQLQWSGADENRGSGVKEYAVYVSENGGPFTVYESSITDTTITFHGSYGKTYCFYTVATDNVGNKEPVKNGCEASVYLDHGIILPITWLYFEARPKANDVVVNWATAMEQETKSFVVERSVDGRFFEEMGTVKAAGNSNRTTNYSFTDNGAMQTKTKMLYYRLRQVEKDGRFTYSSVVAIPVRTAAVIQEVVTAYPNPFRQSITLKIVNVTTSGQSDHVGLYSMEGRLVYQRSLTNRSSETVLLSDLPQLTSGVYLLKVVLNGQLYTIKMIRE
jgi:hypothetical protein